MATRRCNRLRTSHLSRQPQQQQSLPRVDMRQLLPHFNFLAFLFLFLLVVLVKDTRTIHAFSLAAGGVSSSTTNNKNKNNNNNNNKKAEFLDSLDVLTELNTATAERTRALQHLCDKCNPTPRPGSTAAWHGVAPGEWRVVYAPHMDFMGRRLLLGAARFAPVIYQLDHDENENNNNNNNNNTIVSHARVQLPLLGAWWLSASGTYGSVDEDRVSRVTFDEAWVRRIIDEDDADDTSSCNYYATIDDVPDSFEKELIRRVGRTFFIEPFAIFPVSYLDENLVVFDFELLGTRICAYKQPAQSVVSTKYDR